MNSTTASTWAELQAELDALRASLPQLRADYPDDGDFLVAFAGIADEIRARANADDDHSHHVYVALIDMLIEARVIREEERQH